MKKRTIINRITVLALAGCCFLIIPAEAKGIGENTYRICKNDIFVDYDQMNCKKIVTEIQDDGSFLAIDLGDWLAGQDIYDISVMEDDESVGYKKMFYERNPEKEEEDEFYDSEDTSYVHFEGLVYEGDVIRYTDAIIEKVTKVRFDGSFCTQVEQQPSLPFEEEEMIGGADASTAVFLPGEEEREMIGGADASTAIFLPGKEED